MSKTTFGKLKVGDEFKRDATYKSKGFKMRPFKFNWEKDICNAVEDHPTHDISYADWVEDDEEVTLIRSCQCKS